MAAEGGSYDETVSGDAAMRTGGANDDTVSVDGAAPGISSQTGPPEPPEVTP